MAERLHVIGPNGRQRKGWPPGLLCAVTLLMVGAGGCARSSSRERQEQQRRLRAQRLARARALRARNARIRRRNAKWRAKDPPPPRRPPPPGPCVPAEALKRRVESVAFDDRFGQAVRLVLTPVKADLVTLQGKPVQRFTFVVRMHPDQEPRLGRKRPRPLLELSLRFTPLCGAAKPGAEQRLRVQLARPDHKSRLPIVTSLWPQQPVHKKTAVPIGQQVQLLLDPATGQLRPHTTPPRPHTTPPRPRTGSHARKSPRRAVSRALVMAPAPIVRGVWQVTGARFPDRPRTARLSLMTSKLTPALNLLHAVEVPCRKGPRKRCRFLTRMQGDRAVPTTLKELRRLAAPIDSKARVLHLHAALMAIRYFHCVGDNRRVSSRTRHPCARSSAAGIACQLWRAQHGYATPPRAYEMRGQWNVSHVVSCPATALRVLRIEETYTRKGGHSERIVDLTKKLRTLDEVLRKLTRRPRRRP